MIFMREGDIHKALSGPMRQEIIRFLGTGEKYLSEIANHINKTPQTVDFSDKIYLYTMVHIPVHKNTR